jgi:hypothetical protein
MNNKWVKGIGGGLLIVAAILLKDAVPAASITITLQGDDLAILTDSDITRILTIKIVYDSSIGNNLPQNDQDTFEIKPLSQIANG